MLKSSAALSRTTRKEGKSGFLVRITIVILCSLGLQSLRLSNREAKGIRPFAAECFDVIISWFYTRYDGKYILDVF